MNWNRLGEPGSLSRLSVQFLVSSQIKLSGSWDRAMCRVLSVDSGWASFPLLPRLPLLLPLCVCIFPLAVSHIKLKKKKDEWKTSECIASGKDKYCSVNSLFHLQIYECTLVYDRTCVSHWGSWVMVKNLKSTELGGGKVLGVEQEGRNLVLPLLTKDSGSKFGDFFFFRK